MEKAVKFKADGMMCPNCEKVIQKQASTVDGVKSCEIEYATQEGKIVFDIETADINDIFKKIEEKGYKCSLTEKPQESGEVKEQAEEINFEKGSNYDWVGWAIGIVGLILIGYFVLRLAGNIEIPGISQNMGYGLLFLVGLFTGFHCVSMCGGFVVSYTARHAQEGKSSYKAHLMYSLGKIISYTIIGAAFGLLGSIIIFTPMMRGVAGVLAGLFLILFGIKMLNISTVLRRIQFKTPNFLAKFVGKGFEKHSSPLAIGLLNGLMIACGPLQAIYIMAAGTGSLVEGAKLLFIFALGTLPVMLVFSYITSFISSNLTYKILKASGVLVIALGLMMLNNGLALTGSGYDFNSFLTSVKADSIMDWASFAKEDYQEIRMDVTRNGWSPNKFVLKKGVPVKWIINGKEITSCNNAVQVPKLGLNFGIKKGEQVIEFTPTEEGIIPWSCWMGMLQGTFVVKEDVDLTDQQEVKKELASIPTVKSGGCGCGGSGKCGGECGGACGG